MHPSLQRTTRTWNGTVHEDVSSPTRLDRHLLTSTDWFEFPKVLLKDGKWEIKVTDRLAKRLKFAGSENPVFTASRLDQVFAEGRISSNDGLYKKYQDHLRSQLTRHRDEGRKFGALIIEPIVLGAGGMLFW